MFRISSWETCLKGKKQEVQGEKESQMNRHLRMFYESSKSYENEKRQSDQPVTSGVHMKEELFQGSCELHCVPVITF